MLWRKGERLIGLKANVELIEGESIPFAMETGDMVKILELGRRGSTNLEKVGERIGDCYSEERFKHSKTSHTIYLFIIKQSTTVEESFQVVDNPERTHKGGERGII